MLSSARLPAVVLSAVIGLLLWPAESSAQRTKVPAEATVYMGGGTIHADSTEDDMYAAIDMLVDKLDRQVKKHKEKLTDHHAKEVEKPRFR